jgi:hypothetical protein
MQLLYWAVQGRQSTQQCQATQVQCQKRIHSRSPQQVLAHLLQLHAAQQQQQQQSTQHCQATQEQCHTPCCHSWPPQQVLVHLQVQAGQVLQLTQLVTQATKPRLLQCWAMQQHQATQQQHLQAQATQLQQ